MLQEVLEKADPAKWTILKTDSHEQMFSSLNLES